MGKRDANAEQMWNKSGDAETTPTKLLTHWRKVPALAPGLGRGSFKPASEQDIRRAFVWDFVLFSFALLYVFYYKNYEYITKENRRI